MKSKAKLLADLREMLQGVFNARATGTEFSRMARAHGYVDGYMRGLLETGSATKQELLRLVAEERTRVSGPAVAAVAYDDPAAGVAA